MRAKYATLLLSFLLLASAISPLVADPPAKDDLDATMRKLEKDITAVRGLKFKTPVVATVVARPKDAAKGIQAYYSVKDKKVILYDDIAGNYERGVLIHEMVHALQDQHFGLEKLHEGTFGTDGELARAALIEGDATFTMIEVLKADQPKVAAMLDAPLEKAKNLQNAFLYAQGARYVKALKERGGWEAVNFAYKFAPRSTATILHPEGVARIDLGPGKTLGEFGIVKLLAAEDATRPSAVASAAGWRGDRLFESGDGKAWVVAFDTDDSAQRFQASIGQLRRVEKPGYKEIDAGANNLRLEGPKGEILAVRRQGARVFVFDAANGRAYRALQERVEGPPSLTIYAAKEKKTISFGELTDRLLDADIVCVGETHDSDAHHRVQLQIIKALFARDERLGVGMEMFQRPFQKELDRYLAGDAKEDDFLKATEYKTRWGYEWALYRPIADFCRKNGVALGALNAPRELTRQISKVGYDKLGDDEKKQLGEVDFQVKAHRDYWYERLAAMHGQKDVPAEQKEKSYQVMTVWDEYMGASAAQFQKARQLRRMVILAGSGHVERGFGIPDRAAKRTGGKVATIRTEVGVEMEKITDDPAADYVILVK